MEMRLDWIVSLVWVWVWRLGHYGGVGRCCHLKEGAGANER